LGLVYHRATASEGNVEAVVESPTATVGIIGGSGLYSIFAGREVQVETPYGPPSSAVTIAEVDGNPVAFLARHGTDHRLPPHRINYRANIWALHSLGVRRILAPAAVGGLSPGLGPGDLVVPDQLVDWTRGRPQTFHDLFDGVPVHATFADPYCPELRQVALAAAHTHGWAAEDGGTMVVIEGPRFSTRAESRFFQTQGWSVVNMTGHPEAVLARELDICYATIALVTDVDAGAATGEGVTVAEVLAEFARSTDRLRGVLIEAATRAATIHPEPA
jgi:5'-methylthioadenosine phosphorylase